MSASALLVAVAAPAHAGGPAFKSLHEALASHPAPGVVAAATAGGAIAAQQAGLGAANFAKAAARFTSLQQALSAHTYTGTPVPDGIATGGLQQADGVAGSNGGTLWYGASTSLTQSVSNGITSVTVDQTKPVAALTWKSFNVGAHTKLVFDQSAGGTAQSSWIAINSVTDPAANPSAILGEISAPGKVYILNPNGILFGAGSTVNVGALVATTANIAQAQFTKDTNGFITGFSLYGSATGTTSADSFTPTFENAPANSSVIVEPGAVISTPIPSGTNGGGSVMLLAASVTNGGVISTPQGQTVLAAGTNFVLQPGYSQNNPTATVIGSEVAVTNNGSLTGNVGNATNSGIVIADQGDITMVGHAVTQAGVLLATTTIDNRGTVHLLTDTSDATASVVLAPGSITEVLPEELYSLNGTLVTPLENANAASGTLQTALDAQRATNLANSATDNTLRDSFTGPRLNDFNDLTDTLGEGRIEISTGGTVDMQGGALALAQGGQVAVNATGAILVESGATIDVSGTNAILPSSENSLFVQGIVPYYLRDSAANRTGGLEFQNVYIDERTLQEISSGAYAGNIYTEGGLLEVSGNLGLVGHGITEWTAIGGQVTLQSASSNGSVTTGGTITVSSGGTINLTGGTVTYQAGLVQQSYVQAANGEIFNINNAPGNLVYSGVYTGVQEVHPRWNITETFNNPLLTPAAIEESAYTIGRDAGNLTVSAATVLLDGTIAAGVTVGQIQTGAHPATVTDPFLLVQSVAPLAGSLAVGAYSGGVLLTPQFTSTVVLGGNGGSNNGSETVTFPTAAVTGTIALDTDTINQAGLANVSVLTSGDLQLLGSLVLADGGSVTLGGGTVEADAGITAHDGVVTLTNLQSTGLALSSTGGITVAPNIIIDTSGEWTNLARDPSNQTLLGYASGGSVNLISTGGIDIGAGSVLNVSSGGELTTAGKSVAAAGGNITISADILPGTISTYNPAGNVTLAGTFDGLASGAGGTLSITVPYIDFGTLVNGVPQNLYVTNPAAVFDVPDNLLFGAGFADYVFNGYQGVEVDSGRAVTVTRPVYIFSNPNVATGASAAGAYNVVLPQTYIPNFNNDTISQRAGASIAIESSAGPGTYNGGGGPLVIEPGAHVTVDPGQSITVAAYGELIDQGTLTAHGGTITLANTSAASADPSTVQDLNYTPGLSVWIGEDALVNASGEATIFTDSLGRRFGQSQAGGTIVLGVLGGVSSSATLSTNAQVIERPGALLDVSGASATIDVVPTFSTGGSLISFAAPVTLAGNGGLIVARSVLGIALDGGMQAGGAGPGAAGGTLQLRVDQFSTGSLSVTGTTPGLPGDYLDGSRILISEDAVPVQNNPDLLPGQATDATTNLLARISQAQLDSGGFGSLSLFAYTYIAFDGSAALHLNDAVSLETPILGDTASTGMASITAPYVQLNGQSATNFGTSAGGTLLVPGVSQATLAIDAGLIDIAGGLNLGGAQVQTGTITPAFSVFGFAGADFLSQGDIRFDQSPDGAKVATVLASSGNITFRASQLYPTTDAYAQVYAGENVHLTSADTGNVFAGGTLTILGNGAVPASPLSVGGTLELASETVVQDGVVRAPEGDILLGLTAQNTPGVSGAEFTKSVTLGPDSVTSVSLFGQIVPYGGTVDGVNYDYAGNPVGLFNPIISIGAETVTAAPGSSLDLRGGGTLAGAGFIPGRGGTADVNLTPLLNSSTGTVAANTTDPVFAIVPGYTDNIAPLAPGDAGYSTPGVGEQVTIAAGEVPGLAAGTYTLLPAYYDLLPGAYRVELTGGVSAAGATRSFGNFTTLAAVNVDYANTGIVTSLPQAALITSANGVRQLSQYDEESYNDFEATSASTFGAARPDLPQDAKTLQIELAGGASTIDPISIPAASLEKAPAAFSVNGTAGIGYGATVEVSGNQLLEVYGDGDGVVPVAATSGPAIVPISSASLDALTAPVALPFDGGTVDIGTRLELGGTLTLNNGTVTLVGEAADVWLLPHADLTAADAIIISNGGTIALLPGATIDTQNQGASSYGTGTGYLYQNALTAGNASAFPVLAVSNNDLQFIPQQGTTTAAAITLGLGSDIETGTGGSLNFVAPTGTNVQIAPSTLVASYVTLQVSNINVGSATDLAAFSALLPGGLTLTDAAFNALAQNATLLSLTANEAVNLIGDVAINSGSTNLVLNTPAIYGYGTSITDGTTTTTETGSISITAPNFTWGGVGFADPLQTGSVTIISATPGGRLTGSTTSTLSSGNIITASLTGASSLQVNSADDITLGYGPNTQVNDQTMLDRAAVGFDSVTLAADHAITANNQSGLAVWQTEATPGLPGTGGDLTLQAPLITADSGAVLDLTAGGTLTAANPGSTAITGTITTLGATINLTADVVDTATAIALPAGKLSITAQDGIDIAAGTDIDLSGRTTKLFDQTVYSNGGTLQLQDTAASATAITEDAGATINVSSPGANAGSIAATDLGGAVAFNGTLDGSGSAAGGNFAVVAGTLATTNTTLSPFDALNAALDAGGFTQLRAFEVATGDIVVDQTVAAHNISIAADAGNLDIAGTLNASGTTPGTIALATGGTLTLEAGAVLDAHASKTAVDSSGNPIDAENRAEVTLTSTGGSVLLDPGATIDVSYPGAAADPQGQIVINAPRTEGGSILTGTQTTLTGDGVAVSAPGSLTIIGAQAIDLFGFISYSPTDANGTIVQDNGSGSSASSYSVVSTAGILGLVQIDLANQAFMSSINAGSAALETQLAGLVAYGASFNLAPGVEIVSGSASNGNLTISGDLDFSALRYSDPTGFGVLQTAAYGSGESGSIAFRASNDLTVNGSVSDGFAPPPDTSLTGSNILAADATGWQIFDNPSSFTPWTDPTSADLLLPSSAFGIVKTKSGTITSSQIVLLGATDGSAATVFDTSRPISLNYAITILSAYLKANVVIPFAVTIGAQSTAVPSGGWIATSPITRNGVVIYQPGQLVPAGFTFQPGDVVGAGAVFPVVVATADNQVVPAGTSFDVFSGSGGNFGIPSSQTITLAANVLLPANALIPANSQDFFGVEYSSNGSATVAPINTLYLRPATNGVEGELYPLAQMLPAGSQSWNMDFVAGANLAAAAENAVTPLTTLNGGALAPSPTAIDQAPGSLLIDDQHYLNYTAKDASSGNYADAATAFSVIRTGTGDLSLVAGGGIDQSSLYGIYTAGTQDPLGNGQDAQFNSARQALGPQNDSCDGGYCLLMALSSSGSKGTETALGVELSNLIYSTYQAYYPTDGGDVLVSAQGDMTSDVFANNNPGASENDAVASDSVGDWLWRQGGAGTGLPLAWWINFGSLVNPLVSSGEASSTGGFNAQPLIQMSGFEGIGALGGGNLTVTIGGNAGQITGRDATAASVTSEGFSRGEGLVLAVGSTGRSVNGTLITTGGGNLSLTVGGVLNPLDQAAYGIGAQPGAAGQAIEAQSVNGDLVDLLGNITATAGAIGRIDYDYTTTDTLYDPRIPSLSSPTNGTPNGGVVVVEGDGTVSLSTDRDLVLGGTGDAGREAVQALVAPADGSAAATACAGADATCGDLSGFTLWQAGTSISLFAAGGNVTPTSLPNQQPLSTGVITNDQVTEARSDYPPTLLVTAATGDIIYGQPGDPPAVSKQGAADTVNFALETMPSSTGQVAFLAGGSIFANGYAIDLSGADPAGLAAVSNAAYQVIHGQNIVSQNVLSGPDGDLSALSLFALEADTPTTNLHQFDTDPALFYAAGGDIVNFQTGQTINYVLNNSVIATWYIAAKPVWVFASNDIVSTGNRPTDYPAGDATLFTQQENQITVPQSLNGSPPPSNVPIAYASGDLALNNNPDGISVISAGRDILSAYAYVAGPGLLEIDAGRNIDQTGFAITDGGKTTPYLEFGSFKSLGADYTSAGTETSLTGGAGIAVLAGIGAAGPDYSSFADLYFNPDNLANPALLLTDPANSGKVQTVYADQLVSWLATNYGYTGDAAGALAFFQQNVPAVDQNVFVRSIFFTELTAAGAQEADPASRFYHDYLPGQTAIDTLFPSASTTAGVPTGYTGAITAYSGPISLVNGDGSASYTVDGGIATLFGGTVQILDPGGNIEFGIPGGPAPGNNSGIITYGTGDVDIYALGSVLLGESRIFTTGGGNITIWSSDGDINAGIGAKTTVSYNPPVLSYDAEGDVTQEPPASTSGAGIATLQPLPSVPAGNISLIAPVGTVDAGEAGVRVSGNLVLAATRVVGAANITVSGKSSGIPTAPSLSLGAVTAASSAAGASTAAATSAQGRNTEETEVASILDVEVISIGGSYDETKKRKKSAGLQ
ncbi:MAG TPA: filamentous hemagglutinin family protein [Acetobacteraceae bacterium]|nr:filamentous hemagglutinin family protein [Acetobacteraceae bacterium]